MIINIMLDDDACMPMRAHNADAGFDLCSPVDAIVYPGCRTTINTGVHMEIPYGYYGEVMSKSGLLKNSGIFTTGVIDSGYTGPTNVTLVNNSNDPFVVKKKMKIAQLLVKKVEMCTLKVVDSFESTERGDSGFGSSGVFWEG